MKGKYNMNTKGKIDFTKTDNIQFIEEVASENMTKLKKYSAYMTNGTTTSHMNWKTHLT